MAEVNYFGKKIKITEKSVGYYGSFLHGEVFSLETIGRFLKDIEDIPGAVVLDIGACTGSYALLDLVKTDLQVYSFEPSRAFLELRENIKANGSKTLAYNMAVSDADGVGTFNEVVEDGSIALSMLGGQPAGHKNTKSVKVGITTIDTFCGPKISPHAIKIDTEGNELMVLQGGIETIKRCRPIIYCEYCNENTNQYGYDRAEIMKLLLENGYTIDVVDNADIIAKWEK
jgi:FkbM family methyltransferase